MEKAAIAGGGGDAVFLDLLDAENATVPVCDVAYLIAARARLAECRRDPEGSARVNVTAPVVLARKFLSQGARIIFLSSDKVFDGSRVRPAPTDPVLPRSVYGQQKAAAERALLALGDGVTVLRLSKVVEPGDALFTGWLSDVSAGRTITPFDDLWLAPVSVNKVVRVLHKLATREAAGIFQLSGLEDISYVDAARYLVRKRGADPGLVLEASAAANGVPPEERPRYTALDISKTERVLGVKVESPWRELDEGLGLAD